ncbi:hypothetical protein GCM10029964_058010 [Kibdelosporangium lantanae]
MSVLRLLPKDADIAGEILLDGTDVRTMTWGKLRAVRWAEASIVFQGAMHALNPVRRVGQQIAEPIRLHNTTDPARVATRVAELLAQVELPAEKANAYPHELSGGQKQRVMIAMALACEPRLIIADEPTTALDVIVQAQVLDVLTRLVHDQGIGLVMISHDLSVLGSVCERLAVMYDGEIVELGTAATVVDEPQHPHTQALAAAFPTIGDPASRYAPATTNPAGLPTRTTPTPGNVLLRTNTLRVEFPGAAAASPPPSRTSTWRSAKARSSPWSASPDPARPPSPAPSSASRHPPAARSCSTAPPSPAPAAACATTADRSNWSSRTPPAPSTPATPSTRPSPKDCASTTSPATRPTRSPPPSTPPNYAPPTATPASCPTNCPAGNDNASSSPAPSPWHPGCWSPTNPSRPSTPPCAARSSP